MQVYVVVRGHHYEGSTIEGIYAALDEALKAIEANPPYHRNGDEFVTVTAHTLGKAEVGRAIHHFTASADLKWEPLRLWDGTVWTPE
jgi:hypothetical protein